MTGERKESTEEERLAAELAEKEKAWREEVNRFNRIRAVGELEAALDTNAAFDLAKVFMGAQPGDYMSFGKKRAEQFKSLLDNLASLNNEFQYRQRPVKWNQGKRYLEDGHRREIKQSREIIIKHYPDLEFEGDDDVLFTYYNKELIKQKEETFEIENLVDNVFHIREFLDIIAHAPILTPTRKLVEAHTLFGYYFSFPPCCIWDFPRSVQEYRHYLEEKYQIYLEHVPCTPECPLSINHSELNKLAFEITGLNLDSLIKEERRHFKGHLFFRASGSLFERMTKVADKYNGELSEHCGRYTFTIRNRDNLTKAYYEVNAISGIRNLNTNTVIGRPK